MKCILLNKAELENSKLHSNLWSMQHFHKQFVFALENINSEQLFILEVRAAMVLFSFGTEMLCQYTSSHGC